MVLETDIESAMKAIVPGPYGFAPWFDTYGWIRTKDRKLVQPTMNPFQARCAETLAWCRANGVPARILKLKPRQKGCSTISVAELYHMSRSLPMKSVIIGGEYGQVQNLWEIMTLYHARDLFPWDHSGIVNARTATFGNGSQLGWETARDAEAGRSATLQGVLATEAARWKEAGAANATAVITGLLNCVPYLPDTLVILESTALGDYGMFYDYWQDAADLETIQAGATPPGWNGYFRIFSPWFEHADSEDTLTEREEGRIVGTYTDEERNMVAAYGLRPGQISWYRRTLRSECKRDPSVMRREYPATPEEAFHAASNRRFNSAGLLHLETRARQASVEAGHLHSGGERLDYGFFPAPSAENAPVYVADPPAPGHRYLVAVDIATGASQNDSDDPDSHAALVLRDGYFHPDRGWKPPKVVAWLPCPCRWDIDILAQHVFALSRYYGDCLIVPEANNDRGLILLLKQMGANLHERNQDENQPAGARSPKPTGKYGFMTTGGQAENTRNWILENLARAIREWDTDGDGIEVPDLETVAELKSFIVRPSGRAEAADGKHDDRVLALAIGMACLRWATTMKIARGPAVIPADLREHYERDIGTGIGGFS
jgi:hypothetical protein